MTYDELPCDWDQLKTMAIANATLNQTSPFAAVIREYKNKQIARYEREADAAMLRLWHAEADAGMLDEFRAKHTNVVVSPAVGGA